MLSDGGWCSTTTGSLGNSSSSWSRLISRECAIESCELSSNRILLPALEDSVGPAPEGSSKLSFIDTEIGSLLDTGTGSLLDTGTGSLLNTGTGSLVLDTGTDSLVHDTGAGSLVHDTGTGSLVLDTGTGSLVLGTGTGSLVKPR